MARFKKSDAAAVEAIDLRGGVSPFARLRALLYRGRIEEAACEIEKFAAAARDEPQEAVELLQERGRTAALRGRWSDGLEWTDRAIQLSPGAISLQALYQTRALCHFELAEFGRSAADVERAISIASIYPNNVTAIYAQALKARIEARQGGVRPALVAIDKLWKGLQEGKLGQISLTPDLAVALLRAESDIRWHGGLDVARSALPWYLLAEASGEKLFAALALMELYFSAQGEARQRLRGMLAPLAREFERVSTMIEQIESRAADASTSSRTIYERLDRGLCESLSAASLERGMGWESLILLTKRARFERHPCSATDLRPTKNSEAALNLFLDAPAVPKERFFHEIWGEQKYAPRLHEGLIWTLISRMKKQLGPTLGVADGHVMLQPGVVLW